MTTTELLDLARRQVQAPGEIDRRNHHTQLASWYRGNAQHYAHQIIGRAFSDPVNQAVRARFVQLALSAGVLRRAAHETAILYATPARRTIANGPEAFLDLLEDLEYDDVILEASRLLTIHHALWFEAKVVDGQRRLDVHLPDDFAIVTAPDDPRKVIAIAVKIPADNPVPARPAIPAWRLMTADEVYICNAKLELIGKAPHPTPGTLPGELALASPASVRGRILDERPSSELLAAEESTALQSILQLKESVSYTRQTYLSGDVSSLVLGQTADTLSDVVLPEGVTTTAVERGVDLEVFSRVADRVQDVAFSALGIAPAQRRRDAVTSGFDLQLRRLPLLERRRQLCNVWRRIERQLVQHMARVFGFDASGFALDFAEVDQPLSELESLQAFETSRRLGLRTTADELMRRNPDLTYQDAIDLIAANVEEESARIELMQSLAKQNANTSTAVGDSTNGNRDGAPVTSTEKATIQ